jgi:hypothetical protein
LHAPLAFAPTFTAFESTLDAANPAGIRASLEDLRMRLTPSAVRDP